MKILVTYSNQKTHTHIGVEKVEPIKNDKGATEAIYIEGFNFASRLEFFDRAARNQIKSIEILP